MTEPTPIPPPTAVPIASTPVSTNEEVESAPATQPAHTPRALPGQRTVWNELRWIGGKILSGMEYVGEGVAGVLRLDESHFQYVLDGMDEEDWEIAIAVANKRKREQQHQDDSAVAMSLEEGGSGSGNGGSAPISSNSMMRDINSTGRTGSSGVVGTATDELDSEDEDDIDVDADPAHPNPSPFGLVHHREEHDKYIATHNGDDVTVTDNTIQNIPTGTNANIDTDTNSTANADTNTGTDTSAPENSSAALISDINIEMTTTV